MVLHGPEVDPGGHHQLHHDVLEYAASVPRAESYGRIIYFINFKTQIRPQPQFRGTSWRYGVVHARGLHVLLR